MIVKLEGGLGVLPGVKLAGIHAGIKPNQRDLALISFNEPHICASITFNEVKAAPLLVSEEHIGKSGERMRALVCSTGDANACTGERGLQDAREVAQKAADFLGIDPTQVIVASTGIIGVGLPMEHMTFGLERANQALAAGASAARDAAEALMTADEVPKLSAYAFHVGTQRREVGGIATGSNMIAPNMATMLAFIVTNARMSREALQGELRAAVDDSFHMNSVDGDMSTNDVIYAFAMPGRSNAPEEFREALRTVIRDLA